MMAISNQMVIQRMLRELQPLQEKTPSRTELLTHIGNIKLMCELLLENEEGDSEENGTTKSHSPSSVSDEAMMHMLQQTPEMTDEEYNVMIKGCTASEQEKHSSQEKQATQQERTNHNEANGDSIFDF